MEIIEKENSNGIKEFLVKDEYENIIYVGKDLDDITKFYHQLKSNKTMRYIDLDMAYKYSKTRLR